MITCKASDFIPDRWAERLAAHGKVSLGLDVASTIKKRSNPSGLAVMQRQGTEFHVPLEMRWKTKTKSVFFSILEDVITAIPREKRHVLVVDSSNEKIFANDLKEHLSHLIRVVLVGGNDAITYKRTKWQAKRLLGSLLCNVYEDKLIAIPEAQWIFDDHRLVKRDGDSFDADVDTNGCHADNFDAEKLALWGHLGQGAKVEAAAVDTRQALPPQDGINKTRLERMEDIYRHKIHS